MSLQHPATHFFIICLSILIFAGCSGPSIDSWEQMVPDRTFAVIKTEPGTDIRDLLSEPYIPMLDDITPSAIQLASSLLGEEPSASIPIYAMLLYPDTSSDWQPVWVGRTDSGMIETIQSRFTKKYEQNDYKFLGETIRKAFISDRVLFFVKIGGFSVFSESSLAIEDIVRTVNGYISPLSIPSETENLIINTEQLATVGQQLSAITLRPLLENIFDGAGPMSLSFLPGDEELDWEFRGRSAIRNQHSDFVRLLKAEPAPFRLDRYIPVNVAAFGLFRDNPVRFDPDSVASENPADRFLRQNNAGILNLKRSLGSEIAVALFSESGPASESEYLYLREISNAAPVRSLLDKMSENDLAIRDDQTYFVNSKIMGKLFGSTVYPDSDFYMIVYDNVAAFALRKGLVESVGSDTERRRVMFYDDEYRAIMQSFQTPLSSFFYSDADRFSTFIQPWLYPQHYAAPLLNRFDQMVLATRFDSASSSLEFMLKNFKRDETEEPYREQWVYPLNDADLNGKPVFANITGSNRQEIIFSTSDGFIFVLAADGTTILQTSTGDDIPTGAPVVYDWYGNNQPVVMQAAGNKIYAWNSSGEVLPNFPITLNEDITTPLIVQDLLANGVPEIVVATANRNLHVLNNRGLPVSGWPQSTSSVINARPLIANFEGEESIFTFSENILHAWDLNGQRRNGFPVFLPSQMNDRPVLASNHILGAGLDGDLYAVGNSALFSDSLATILTSDSLTIESIPVSNSGLSGEPVYRKDLMVRTDEGLVREDVILTLSENGSLFMYTTSGELLLTQNMGQPASSNSTPFIVDINSDDRLDVVATASFGRLYAWDILSGERHLELPTAAMAHPVVNDFNGNGFAEVIAQTREGLQSWTIFFTRRESMEQEPQP